MLLPQAILVDIDGTLANVEHRIHHVRGPGRKNWKEFFREMEKDTHEAWAKLITNHLPVAVILLTGRPQEYEERTRAWLQANEIHYDLLIMRKTGDYRQDNIVKRELYEAHVKNKFEVVFVLDDRQQVVDMWRQIGLTCLQCRPGDF